MVIEYPSVSFKSHSVYCLCICSNCYLSIRSSIFSRSRTWKLWCNTLHFKVRFYLSAIFIETFARKILSRNLTRSFVNFSVLHQNRIDLMSMLGVYIVLGVGIIVALLALIGEFMWKRKERKINSKDGSARFVSIFLS